MMSAPRATIGIISIGQMGVGIAKLLISQNYRVVTNISDRSPATHQRASSASIECLSTDANLVHEADYILSIVPPKDAVATAQRIIDAYKSADQKRQHPLYYLDLNAIAPSTARGIDALFKSNTPDVRFIDGGIIGGPPSPLPSSSSTSPENVDATSWTRPGIPYSGPYHLHDNTSTGTHLASVLNTRYVDATIGTASGLKCSFAALSKGFIALALQSYTTASNLGVVEDLQFYLDAYNPNARTKAERGITGCSGKAHRWVEEMRQIGICFGEEGGWRSEARVFEEVQGVYAGLAGVVEKRGGTEGMEAIEGAVEVLRRGLKEGRVRKEEVEELLK